MTNKDLILASLMRAMIKYDGGDAPRIQHFVKVHDFARMIAMAEGMNQEDLFVLEAAAILHDVGIHVSEAKYGNCDGKHHLMRQEKYCQKLMDSQPRRQIESAGLSHIIILIRM